MAYDGKVMRQALQRFEEDRRAREERDRERRESVFRRSPRLREIEMELRSTMGRLVTAAFRRGVDPAGEIAGLRRENLRLQWERQSLLNELGLPEDCLEEKPACALCGDTGYREGRVCRCLRGYYAREQQRELSRMLDLGTQSFETFSLDWYSEEHNPALGISARENMDWVYRSCKKYAENFGPGSGSLLLTGKPDVERVLNCDLLILDDLGTELTTAFVQSALYQIVNTRLIERRSTILSTNLMPSELAQRYSPQAASRIEGEYQLLPFVGEDIRRLKRERE